MAIIINTKKTGIPVRIGELDFTVDTTDKGLEQLVESYKEIVKEMEKFDGDGIGDAKELLTKGFDLFLGGGSFEKIYEQTSSVTECANYLEALVLGVTEELQEINKATQREKVDKYLKHKKKK